MRHFISTCSLLSGLLGALALTACTQMPTEKQGVADLRPQISFRADHPLHGARVMVDGLDMGAVGSYLDGVAALKILPGGHLLQINAAGRIVFEEKFYVGDGVNRSFSVR